MNYDTNDAPAEHDCAAIEEALAYERSKSDWIPGAPSTRGRYWIYWHTLLDEDRVDAIELSPAVLNPDGNLLCKLSSGVAYRYSQDGIRSQISHHIPILEPAPPKKTT